MGKKNRKNIYLKIVIISSLSFSLAILYQPLLSAQSTNLLTSLKTKEFPDKTQVIITTEEKAKYKYFDLENPLRLVIDLSSTTLNLDEKTMIINKVPIKKIRSGQFEKDTARVVIELLQPPGYILAYGLERQENRIIANIAYHKTVSEVESPTLPEEKVTIDFLDTDIIDVLRILTEYLDLSLLPGPNVSGTITVQLRNVPAKQALDLILKVYGFSSRQLGNILMVSTPEVVEEFPKEAGPITSQRFIIKHKRASDLKPELEGMLSKAGKISIDPVTNTLIIEDYQEVIERIKPEVERIDIAPLAGLEIKTRIFPLKYVSLKEIKVAVEKFLSEKGKIALDSVAKTLLIEDYGSSLDAISELMPKIDVDPEKEKTPITKIIPLTHISAEDAKSTLSKLLSEAGSIDLEKETNSLILTDIPSKQELIQELITKLDIETVKPKRVRIEALIVELTQSATRELGINWSVSEVTTDSSLAFSTPGVQPLEWGEFYTPGGTAKTAVIPYVLLRLRTSLNENDFNVLSRPRIVSIDGEQARIQVGERIPITTHGPEGVTETTFEETGIILTVTPHISPKTKEVTMEIHQEVSAVTGWSPENQPIIATREAQAVIYVKDGGTVALGGLLRDIKTKSVTGIPILRKLPLLGRLFRRTYETKDKVDLVIFLSPHILSDEEKLTAEERERIGQKKEKKKKRESEYERIEKEILGETPE